MKKNYALEYLDHLITEQLNPSNLFLPAEDQQEVLIEKIAVEKLRVQAQIKDNVFSLRNEDHCAALVKKYYEALVNLIDTAYALSKHTIFTNNKNQQVIEFALVVLEELLRNVELNYRRYLDADIRVSQKELEALKAELLPKVQVIPQLFAEDNSATLIDIVMQGIEKFFKRIDQQDVITQKEYIYHSGFINDLYHHSARLKIIPECPSLHEIILYWNFNSKAAISYLAHELEELIALQSSAEQKIDFIRMHFMRLLHLPGRTKTVYDVAYPGLKSYFTALMSNQKEYYESQLDAHPQKEESISEPSKPVKILVNLSADQIAIFLRLLADLNILLAKNLSVIYETIVRFLFTQRKDSLSWSNVRSKSYNPEKRDIDFVIKILERGIKILEEY